MENNITVREFASLRIELANCRDTILSMEDSLFVIQEQNPENILFINRIDFLLKKMTEKRLQLNVLENMLLQRQNAKHLNDVMNANTTLLRKAIEIRIQTHKEEINETRDYYYTLLGETQVA